MRTYLRCAIVLLTLFLVVSCGGGGSSNVDDGDGDGDGGTLEDTEIRFDISDAVAILRTDTSNVNAQTLKSSSSGSNVHKLNAAGVVEDIFESTDPVLASSLYIAPDGKLYVLLQSPVVMGEDQCVLLRLGKDGSGICVDSELAGVDTFSIPTNSIQFDDDGNIYYSGYTNSGDRVLRKRTSSLDETTDLVNDNIEIQRFLVKGDGVVYLSGDTTSTQTKFFRRVLTTGVVENLINGSDIQSLYELPDGNVYAGDWGKKYGVIRVTDQGLDDALFIGYTSMNGISYYASFYVDDNAYDTCTNDNRHKYEGFCGMSGAVLSYYYRSPDDAVYVVPGDSGDSASLWQYWPEIKPIDTTVLRPTIVKGTMTTLIVAGYDESTKNRLISYNTANSSEIDLLKGEDIEVYHFSYSAGTGRILFDGLRFSDNTYIVASIDTQNGNELTVLETGVKYEDLQFFQ